MRVYWLLYVVRNLISAKFIVLSYVSLWGTLSSTFQCLDHTGIFPLSENTGQIDMGRRQKSPRKDYLTGRQVGFLQFPYTFWQKYPPDVHIAACLIYRSTDSSNLPLRVVSRVIGLHENCRMFLLEILNGIDCGVFSELNHVKSLLVTPCEFIPLAASPEKRPPWAS